MLFSDVLDTLRQEDGGWSATVSDDWEQGRSVFGGLQAALLLRVMRSVAPAGVPLRTLQTTFVAPVPAGTLRLQARLLRSGKSASQVEARLLQGEYTLCSAIGVFGAARESSVRIVPSQPAVECAKPLSLPYIAGISPSFVQHFSVRWLRGGLPYSGSSLPEIVAAIDLLDRGGAVASEEHVLGIADYIPPIGLSMLKRPAPGSSMTWMIELFGELLEGLPLQGWRMDGELVAAGEGYTSQSGVLWGPQGRLVALSRQSMVVFG